MENMAKVVNSTPNASIRIPSTKYKIKKLIEPNFKSETYIKCNKCLNHTPTSTNEIECKFCHTPIKTANSEFFVYIPVEQQFKQSIEENFDEIMSYHVVQHEKEITDIHNCKLFAQAQKKHPFAILLPLVINTDGVQVYRSGSKSLWLIQYYQCFLKPSNRFKPSNIMVVGAHFGAKKPNMKEFFFPFLNEMNDIFDKGGISINRNGNSFTFMPIILGACCDLPAKAELQSMIGHSGHFACGYCLHPGIAIKTNDDKKSVIRYTKGIADHEIRSHQSVIETYKKLKLSPVNGIKSVSCMIAAHEFDLINGFAIDSMHCIYLGITKKLLNLWLDSKYHLKQWYITKKNQVILSNRLVKIKPISDIMRRPRSIFSKSDFKANEYRSFLLYFLRFSLSGMLESKYIRHFNLLCSAIYTLSKPSISREEIEQARFKLKEFADDFEILYGTSNVTLNLHLLRHLTAAVENLGPLWATTAFGFEANNGVVAKANTCTSNILNQLVWKYSIKKSNYHNVDEVGEFGINGKKIIKVTSNECNLLFEKGFNQGKNMLIIYKNVVSRGIKYTSLQTKEISTIDYFVRLRDGRFASVSYYTIFDNIIYALVNLHEIVEIFDHFIEIQSTVNQELIKMIDIEQKLIYLKFGRREFVTVLANRFEKS